MGNGSWRPWKQWWCQLTLGKWLGAVLVLEVGLWFTDQLDLLPAPKGVPALSAVVVAALASVLVIAWWGRRVLSAGSGVPFDGRIFLTLVLVVAVPSGWFATSMAQSQRQEAAVDALRAIGFEVEHEPPIDTDTLWGPSRLLEPAPTRLPRSVWGRLLGSSFFCHVAYLSNVPIGGKAVSSFSDTDMDHLRDLARLRHLDLHLHAELAELMNERGLFTDVGMSRLEGLVKLQRLSLVGCRQISNRSLENLEAMSQLQRLCLYGARQIGDAALAHLRGLRGLHELSITDGDITGTGFEELGRLEQLRVLQLSGNPISDVGTLSIAKLGNLEALFLDRTGITDAGVESIASLQDLQVLSLDSTSVGDEGLRHLAGSTNLRILCLANTRVTDHGLKHVNGLQLLEQLDLTNTRVTDHGLQALRSLTKLRCLDIDGTDVTDAGRDTFKAIESFSNIDFEGPVIWWRY